MKFLDAVWIWDNSVGTFLDRSVEATTSGGTAFSILEDLADFLYFGFANRFDFLKFIGATAGSVGARTWQYSTGTANPIVWKRFIPVINFDFSTVIGAEEWKGNLSNWSSIGFTATDPHTATPPDTTARYWIRVSVISVTTAPTMNQIEIRPYALYSTPSDVGNLLQLPVTLDATTVPSFNTVEDFINRAQSWIDWRTRKSWKPNIKLNELEEFNIDGVRLLKRDIQNIIKLEIWNGSVFETKTEGRTKDYFPILDIGMVFFSRYFLLPARMITYSAPVWTWGTGEFKFPVQVSYIYGRDFDTDEQASLIWDIATKKASIDLLQSHDYSFLAVSGTDKIPLMNKVDFWREEIEERCDSLRGWEVL